MSLFIAADWYAILVSHQISFGYENDVYDAFLIHSSSATWNCFRGKCGLKGGVRVSCNTKHVLKFKFLIKLSSNLSAGGW